MRTRVVLFFLVFLALLVLSALLASVFAGANAGGTLILHSIDTPYTSDGGYCSEPAPETCELAVTEVANPTNASVWILYAAFGEEREPRLLGLEFGVSYSAAIGIVDWGMCGVYENTQAQWPSSGRGVQMVYGSVQTERIIPVYWFAGYTYSATGGVTFEVTPHPVAGGHFADDKIPPIIDTIHAYGSLGFGNEGTSACPTGPMTHTVHADGSGDFPTIQSALDWASNGSIVELSDGVYNGDGNRNLLFNDTAVTLRSISGNPDACIIDCEGSAAQGRRGLWLVTDEDNESVIEGITIRNGYATRAEWDYDAEGGAIHMRMRSSLVVRNCIFEDCTTELDGGAIQIQSASLTLEDCEFRGNRALDPGGAHGGALVGGQSDVSMKRCLFEDNGGSDVIGGSFRLTQCNLVIEDCVFERNIADVGGGGYMINCEAEVRKTTWDANEANQGGGLACWRGEISLDDCTFVGNDAPSGSGLWGSNSDPTVIQIENTILAFGQNGAAIECNLAEISTRRCDIYGNAGGDWDACFDGAPGVAGNLSVDPLFCDRDGGDFHLQSSSTLAGSMGIDSGVIGAWPVGCSLGPLGSQGADGLAAGFEIEGTSLTVMPNPFRFEVALDYSIATAGPVRLTIYDARGREIRTLIDEPSREGGSHSAQWNGEDSAGNRVAAGTYFSKLSTRNGSTTQRMVLLR